MRILAWGLAVLLWMGAIASATTVLMRYESAAGSVGEVATHWPSGMSLRAPVDRCAAVLAIHPRCPCTRATLTEFEAFLARSSRPVEVHVVCCLPERASRDWKDTELTRRVQALVLAAPAGSSVIEDLGGRVAAAFGMETSGHVLLYAPGGELLFSGGITVSRGQIGENAGLERLLAAERSADQGKADAATTTPVLGCALIGPERCPLCGGAP